MSRQSKVALALEQLLRLDRRWIFLLILVVAAIPIIVPIGLPVTTTESTRRAFDLIETLKHGDTVLISFDYGPSSAPENDPMAEAVMRQCALKKVRFIAIALYSLGGLARANSVIAQIASEFPDLKYGIDYVNLGYKDGAAAAMRGMGNDIARVFPTDVSGTPLRRIPIMRNVLSLHQVKAVFSVATGPIGQYWITQVNAQVGTPVIIGPTAVTAPMYYAFLNSGQLTGMLGGMKGAAEYEHLLSRRYPELAHFYESTKAFTATKGMDAQTVVHATILGFILMGNTAFLLSSGRATG